MKFKNNTVKLIGIIAAVLLAVIAVWFFFADIVSLFMYLLRLFSPFILGYLVSLLANPLADKLQKRLKLPRGITAILVILLTVGLLGGIIFGIVWKLVDEIKSLYTGFPDIYAGIKLTFENLSNNLSDIYNILPSDVQELLTNIGDGISKNMMSFINGKYTPVVKGAGNFAKSLPSIFIGVIVFILSLYFMVTDAERVNGAIKRYMPKKLSEAANRVSAEIKKYLGGYVRAQLIIMVIAFCIMLVGLSILGTDYALLIALGTAVLDALPFFGSGAVLIPWSIVSFITGGIKNGVGLLIIYLSVVLTRQLIEPKIVSEKIGMYPIFTLMSMYVGYNLFSIGGMILGPIILMLAISFYKAGIFTPIIRFAGKAAGCIRKEFRELFGFLNK